MPQGEGVWTSPRYELRGMATSEGGREEGAQCRLRSAPTPATTLAAGPGHPRAHQGQALLHRTTTLRGGLLSPPALSPWKRPPPPVSPRWEDRCAGPSGWAEQYLGVGKAYTHILPPWVQLSPRSPAPPTLHSKESSLPPQEQPCPIPPPHSWAPLCALPPITTRPQTNPLSRQGSRRRLAKGHQQGSRPSAPRLTLEQAKGATLHSGHTPGTQLTPPRPSPDGAASPAQQQVVTGAAGWRHLPPGHSPEAARLPGNGSHHHGLRLCAASRLPRSPWGWQGDQAVLQGERHTHTLGRGPLGMGRRPGCCKLLLPAGQPAAQ